MAHPSMTDRFGHTRPCVYLIECEVGGHRSPLETVIGGREEALVRVAFHAGYADQIQAIHDDCWNHMNDVWGVANPPPEVSSSENYEAVRAWYAAFFAEISRWLAAQGIPEDAHELFWLAQPGENFTFRTIEVPLAPGS